MYLVSPWHRKKAKCKVLQALQDATHYFQTLFIPYPSSVLQAVPRGIPAVPVLRWGPGSTGQRLWLHVCHWSCLHRSFLKLSFECCFSSASNLCARWICLTCTAKYILLVSYSVQNCSHSCVHHLLTEQLYKSSCFSTLSVSLQAQDAGRLVPSSSPWRWVPPGLFSEVPVVTVAQLTVTSSDSSPHLPELLPGCPPQCPASCGCSQVPELGPVLPGSSSEPGASPCPPCSLCALPPTPSPTNNPTEQFSSKHQNMRTPGAVQHTL